MENRFKESPHGGGGRRRESNMPAKILKWVKGSTGSEQVARTFLNETLAINPDLELVQKPKTAKQIAEEQIASLTKKS